MEKILNTTGVIYAASSHIFQSLIQACFLFPMRLSNSDSFHLGDELSHQLDIFGILYV